MYFPYDEGATTRRISPTANVSDAQWRDLNVEAWGDLAHVPTWNDFRGSEHLEEIRRIIGPEHRRDALHVDSAYKTGCRAFVTTDGDILKHSAELEHLLGIRFFYPERDAAALRQFIVLASS